MVMEFPWFCVVYGIAFPCLYGMSFPCIYEIAFLCGIAFFAVNAPEFLLSLFSLVLLAFSSS